MGLRFLRFEASQELDPGSAGAPPGSDQVH
jgi:hypothetical protein